MRQSPAKPPSVHSKVRSHVSRLVDGEPFSVRDLLALGPRAAVDKTLSRMVASGELVRPTRGVYAKPRINQTLGRQVPVEPESIVRVIARSTGARVGVHGAEAARRFGLSTQVPLRPVYATSGKSRTVHLSTGEVSLVHAAPRAMQWAGTPAGDALAALLYLGRQQVTPDLIARVRSVIGEEEFATLTTAAVPSWLSDQFYWARAA